MECIEFQELEQMYRLLNGVRIVTQLEVFRRALGRQRPSMALAIQGASDAHLGLSSDNLRNLEHRRIELDDDRLEKALVAYFRVESIAHLGVGFYDDVDRYWGWMDIEEKNAEVQDRRKLLRSLGAAAGAAATGRLLPVSALVAQAQSLAEAGGARRSIGKHQVLIAQETATDLAVKYVAEPSPDTVRAAKAHAYTLFDLLKHGSATMESLQVGRDLQAVASDAASLAGHADFDAGRLEDAEEWFKCALELARAAGDRRLEACALGSFAVIPMYAAEPDHAAALKAFESAAAWHRFCPPAGRAFLFGNLALEHAAIGQGATSGQFLELARANADLIRFEEAGWGFWSGRGELDGWDGVRLDVFGATRDLRLHRPAAAISAYDQALAFMNRPVRRAHLHGDAMRACVLLGECERACASGHAALDEARVHGLTKWPSRIRAVRTTFRKDWTRLPCVRELDERLRLAA